MDKYLASVAEDCEKVPLIDKNIVTEFMGVKYTITIKVHQSTYGEREKYLYWYIGSTDCTDPARGPFMLSKYEGDVEGWDVVANNSLLMKTFEYIAMSDDELWPLTRNHDPAYYRARLIKFVYDMWD